MQVFANDPKYNSSLPPDTLSLHFPVKGPYIKSNKTFQYTFRGEIVDPDENEIDLKATFDPEIFFNIILPPIIFHAGYSLKRKYFFRNLGAILTFAIIGTTISSFIVGALMYGFVQLMPAKLASSITFLDTLYFGALISSTDPLTILAIFNDLHVDVNLYALVFGESVLNDAVAIVLSGSIQNYEERYQSRSGGFETKAFFKAVGDFFGIFMLSLLIGAVMGCVTALISFFSILHQFILLVDINLSAMGSKRSKKNKQELELFPEKNNIKKNKEKDETLEPEIKDFNIIENNGVVPAVISKAPKRKKKSEGIEEVPKKLKKTNDSGSDTRKVKPRKRKSKADSISSIENVENEAQLPVNGENQMEISENNLHKVNKNDHADKKKEEITWPDQDIGELINRMESNIPEKDILAYRSRVEKLNWDNVAFKSYTPEECKKTWMQVQKRIRRFRLLSEILNDAKEWINSPRINHKAPRPSDITKLVGQTYKNLPPEKREKYEKLAASNREEYLEKLKVFFENHPEFVPPPKTNHKLEKEKAPKVEKEKMPKPEKEKTPKTLTKVEKEKVPKVEKDKVLKDKDKDKPKGERAKPGRPPKSSPKAIKERPPKKCQTPFGLYYASELKNMEPGTEKQVFRDKCKMQYKQMSDKKKMFWITLAEQDLIRYQMMEEYKLQFASYLDSLPEEEKRKNQNSHLYRLVNISRPFTKAKVMQCRYGKR
ncbi:sodium/hydrogen exchanger 7, partial [Asbolus verrucosus]